MNETKFKNAVITILTAFKEDFLNNSLMRGNYKEYAVNRIERAMRNYERGLITAREALEIGTNPFNRVTDENGKITL